MLDSYIGHPVEGLNHHSSVSYTESSDGKDGKIIGFYYPNQKPDISVLLKDGFTPFNPTPEHIVFFQGNYREHNLNPINFPNAVINLSAELIQNTSLHSSLAIMTDIARNNTDDDGTYRQALALAMKHSIEPGVFADQEVITVGHAGKMLAKALGIQSRFHVDSEKLEFNSATQLHGVGLTFPEDLKNISIDKPIAVIKGSLENGKDIAAIQVALRKRDVQFKTFNTYVVGAHPGGANWLLDYQGAKEVEGKVLGVYSGWTINSAGQMVLSIDDPLLDAFPDIGKPGDPFGNPDYYMLSRNKRMLYVQYLYKNQRRNPNFGLIKPVNN